MYSITRMTRSINYCLLTFVTSSKRIASIVVPTMTNWPMVGNRTRSVYTTASRTRTDTTIGVTRQFQRTVPIVFTLNLWLSN